MNHSTNTQEAGPMPNDVHRAIRELVNTLFEAGDRKAAIAAFVSAVCPDDYFQYGARHYIIDLLGGTKAARWVADDIEAAM